MKYNSEHRLLERGGGVLDAVGLECRGWTLEVVSRCEGSEARREPIDSDLPPAGRAQVTPLRGNIQAGEVSLVSVDGGADAEGTHFSSVCFGYWVFQLGAL